MSIFSDQITNAISSAKAESSALITYKNNKLTTISYKNLKSDIEYACTVLERLGVQKGMSAAFCYTNEYEVVILDLAFIKLGVNVFSIPDGVPLDLESFIEEHKINIFLKPIDSRGYNINTLKSIETEMLFSFYVYLLSENIQDNSDKAITYVFGSGTESASKCIEIVLDNCLSDFEAFSIEFGITKDDKFFVFLPLSVLQQRVMIYSTLLRQGTVCLSNPQEMMKAIKVMKPTIFVAPPLFYEVMISGVKKKASALNKLTGNTLFDFMEGRLAKGGLCTLFAKFVGKLINSTLGGSIRFMLVGMAMSKSTTIKFFNRSGIPLFEAYGLSETGIISINTPNNNKVGTVGKTLKHGEIEISDAGEILVKRYDNWSTRYLNVSEEVNQQSFPSDGIYATGDLGEFDDDGYLILKGRKNTLLALSSGFKVQPEPIEAAVLNLPGIDNAVLIGQGRPFLVLIASISLDAPVDVKQTVTKFLDEFNSNTVKRGVVRNVVYTDIQFSVDNELLNRSLKINRSNVESFFNYKLELLYSESEAVFEI